MREALFIKQNAEKWKHYENFHSGDPDDLARFFVDVTDDLAYSRTFFPNSKTTSYLNGLASRFHQSIYRNKKEKKNRIAIFWGMELPLLFRKYRPHLIYAFVFFIAACGIGIISAKYDDRFLQLILGDQYVNMTNENIAKGDPFGVYKQQGEFSMFFYIALNNLFVAFRTVVLGIFFSVGTVVSLVANGIMLGSFEYFFFSKGLGWQSVLVIWIHGTLEISAIVLAGGAGLVIGNSILFPRTYTRLQSFQRGARDGVKICIGIAPIFIVAAILEGYVTRHTQMPVWLSLTILILSAGFIVWYVIIYPNKLHNLNMQSHGTKS